MPIKICLISFVCEMSTKGQKLVMMFAREFSYCMTTAIFAMRSNSARKEKVAIAFDNMILES